MPPELTVDYVAEHAAAGAIGNVHLSIYRGELNEEILHSIHRSHLALLDRAAEGTAVFALAEDGTPLPGRAVRRLASRLGVEVQDRVRCSAQVLPGSGFWTSAARSALTAMLTLQTSAYPVRVFGDTRRACGWLVSANGVSDLGEPELVRAVQSLRDAR